MRGARCFPKIDITRAKGIAAKLAFHEWVTPSCFHLIVMQTGSLGSMIPLIFTTGASLTRSPCASFLRESPTRSPLPPLYNDGDTPQRACGMYREPTAGLKPEFGGSHCMLALLSGCDVAPGLELQRIREASYCSRRWGRGCAVSQSAPPRRRRAILRVVGDRRWARRCRFRHADDREQKAGLHFPTARNVRWCGARLKHEVTRVVGEPRAGQGFTGASRRFPETSGAAVTNDRRAWRRGGALPSRRAACHWLAAAR